MLKCFPLAYTTDDLTLSSLIHMSGPSPMYGQKVKLSTADFFSVTPQLIWDRFVTEKDRDEDIKGYYYLPSAK
jgi:hypothetical protein